MPFKSHLPLGLFPKLLKESAFAKKCVCEDTSRVGTRRNPILFGLQSEESEVLFWHTKRDCFRSLLHLSPATSEWAGPSAPAKSPAQTSSSCHAAAFKNVGENQGLNTTTAEGKGALLSAPTNRSRPRTNRI